MIMSKITVVGSFSMDLNILVDEFVKPSQTIIGKKLIKTPGGKGANQCVAIARLGGDVSMIGMLGEDGDGQSIKELFINENINVDHVLTTSKEPTTVALIEINKEGQNRIIVVPAANFEYSVEDLLKVKDTITSSKLVVLQLEMQMDVIKKCIEICDQANVEVLLNPAPAQILSKELLEKVTYLTPNETELALLTSMPTETMEEIESAANKLVRLGVKNVIVTCSSRGAMIVNQNGAQLISGYKVEAIDTVAAGDSFNGAFATQITSGKTIEEAVKFANAVGAVCVTKQGAISSLPTLEEVENFLKNN